LDEDIMARCSLISRDAHGMAQCIQATKITMEIKTAMARIH